MSPKRQWHRQKLTKRRNWREPEQKKTEIINKKESHHQTPEKKTETGRNQKTFAENHNQNAKAKHRRVHKSSNLCATRKQTTSTRQSATENRTVALEPHITQAKKYT